MPSRMLHGLNKLNQKATQVHQMNQRPAGKIFNIMLVSISMTRGRISLKGIKKKSNQMTLRDANHQRMTQGWSVCTGWRESGMSTQLSQKDHEQRCITPTSSSQCMDHHMVCLTNRAYWENTHAEQHTRSSTTLVLRRADAHCNGNLHKHKAGPRVSTSTQ